MTKLLASVMSVEEARIALDCGADIIDCKNPSSGALGALSNETISEIAKSVGNRRPVSATIGDVPMQPDLICEAVASKLDTGADYIKVGFFPEPVENQSPSSRASAMQFRIAETIAILASLASKTSLIAVLFADQRPNLNLLPALARAGFTGVMLDTANKSSGGLTSRVSYALLARFVSTAQGLGLTAGLAGSLKIEDVPRLLELSPDYLGFRSALCVGNRTSSIARSRATAIRRSMHTTHLPVIVRKTAPALRALKMMDSTDA